MGTAGIVTGCGRDELIDAADGGTGGSSDGGGAGGEGGHGGGSEAGGEGGGQEDAGTQLPPDEPEETPEAHNFQLGVASGDVTASRAVLWTRYQGGLALWLRVWRMEGEVYAERVADVAVTPGEGGFIHLDVDGLQAGEKYRYAFFGANAEGELVARSPIGRFRAAFAPGTVAPLVIGACSCTKQGTAPRPLERAGEHGLDLFLLLGDTSYNDSCTTLDEYRTQWAANLSLAGYRALRASTSVLATWDDHEVTNNFNPEEISPTRLAIAVQTYFESLPLRRDAAAPDRLWKSVKWGDTAEFFVLDSRGERKPSTVLSADNVYVSAEQLAWLKAGLKASTAVFKVVLNSTPISDFGFSGVTFDTWVNYPSQRREILKYIEDEAISGVLWISGDHHFASVGKVTGALQLGPGKNAWEVLAGPGAQTSNPLYVGLNALPSRWPVATGTNNYTRFEFDPAAGTVRVVFINGDGDEFATHTISL